MSDKLAVVEQKEVSFYDDPLTAVRADDGQIYVSVDHMCQALSITTAPQTRRIKRSNVLLGGYVQLAIYSTKLTKTVSQVNQQRRRSGLLRVDLVPLWLTGISTSSVKKESQEKLERFQQEAAKVLWEAFQEGRLTADPTFDDLLENDSEAVQAYKMAAAIMKLARTQIMLEARLENSETQLVDHEHRLEQIETQLGSGSTITPDQATAISQAVKTVARALGKQTGRNEYGGVYGELYRRYRIPTYRELPAAKYEDAIKWLGDWLESLTGENPF